MMTQPEADRLRDQKLQRAAELACEADELERRAKVCRRNIMTISMTWEIAPAEIADRLDSLQEVV
jgi:hypothetical protein